MKCLNINAESIVIDRLFLKKQALNTYIRIMITFLIVEELSIIKYKINEYILILIYIYDKDNVIDERVQACFIRKVYIIDDLKINIFFDNDINNSKDITIFIEDYIAHINNCNVTISLKIRIIEIAIVKSVYQRKIIVILSKSKFSVEIHHLAVFNKKYLFKLEKILSFIVYVHLINAFIKTILLRNKFNISMQISRNDRLRKITKMNYFNIFHIFNDNNNKDETCNLIVKQSRSFKQTN